MQKRIRSAEPSDARAIRDIYAPFVSDGVTSFEAAVPSVEDMVQRIQDLRSRHAWLVFEANQKVLGYAYASPHRTRHAYQWCVEVSVYVHGDARNCGVGRSLYAALFEVLRRQGYVNAYAGITLPNLASVRLHESLGFVPIGTYRGVGYKFGEWHDVAWFHLRLSDAPIPVEELRPGDEILGQADVQAFFEECARAVRLPQ